LERTTKIFEGFSFPKGELTVGDLTEKAEEKRRNRLKEGVQYIRNREQGLSVGDLTGREVDGRDTF
jgi:hypothetical protein